MPCRPCSPDNRVQRATSTNSKAPSLLTGFLFDQAGERLTPTWSIKKGTRYRYYVSTSLVKGGRKTHSTHRRIPAGNLESVVIERLQRLFSNQAELLDAIESANIGGSGQRQMIQRGHEIAEKFAHMPEQNRSIVKALVRRVEIGPDSVKVDLSQDRLAAVLSSSDVQLSHDKQIDSSDDHVLALTAPVQLTRLGREMKLLVGDSSDNRAPDLSLLRIIARAQDVQRRLAQDTTLTVHDIARQEHVTSDYLYIVLRLRWLAPDIIAAIVNGRQPPQLNAKRLMRMTAQLPADWPEQKVLLGFR